MPRLVIQSPEFEGRVFDLPKTDMTLGRLPENDIHIDHGSVSGHHAVLVRDGEDYLVRDLNSTNGTRVNGAKITQQKLQRGDAVQFGNIQLVYDSEVASSAQPLPEVQVGLDVSHARASQRPPDFSNASPFGRRHQAKTGGIDVLVTLSFILALGGVGFLAFKLFGA